jgi:hypothetical protein
MTFATWLKSLFDKPTPNLPIKNVARSYSYEDYWPHTRRQPEHCTYCYGRRGANWSKCPKPTIFAPIPYFSQNDWPQELVAVGADKECKWYCTECDEHFKQRKKWFVDRYNNTIEGAKLTFKVDKKDGKIKFGGYNTIDADFEVTFESLIPYVRATIDAADPWDGDGIGFDAIVIRNGQVSIRGWEASRPQALHMPM